MLFNIVKTIKASVKGGNIIFFKEKTASPRGFGGRFAADKQKIFRQTSEAKKKKKKKIKQEMFSKKKYETVNKK